MPNLALSIANVALAILLCAVGVRSIVSYLRGSILDGVMGLQLAAGLVALCFALLLLFNPLFLAELLPFVWGVALLVGGFGKVQMAADLKRIGDRFWWYALIAALLSFVLGALAITRPVFIAAVLTQFVGASLLVEGVLDLVSFLTLNKRIKNFAGKWKTIPASNPRTLCNPLPRLPGAGFFIPFIINGCIPAWFCVIMLYYAASRNFARRYSLGRPHRQSASVSASVDPGERVLCRHRNGGGLRQ